MGVNSQTIQFIQVTPEQLQNAIIEGVKHQLNQFKKHFKPNEPNEYLSRSEVAKMLSINESTVHNWKTKGILSAYQIGGRVFFKRKEVESAIVKLKN
jgi:excisionase family DNA binding protein